MQSNIRKGFEQHLISMVGGISKKHTAFENVSYTPSPSTPYQMSRLVPLPVENPTLGDGYNREVGFYQIVLSYPRGKGLGEMVEVADNLKRHFKRGTTLVVDNDKIIIDRTPEIAPTYINDNRTEMIIRVRYYCEQFDN